MITVTSTPDQSAMALPKNEPRWVSGSERMYATINVITTPNAPRPRECLRRNDFGAGFGLRPASRFGLRLGSGLAFGFMQLIYARRHSVLQFDEFLQPVPPT